MEAAIFATIFLLADGLAPTQPVDASPDGRHAIYVTAPPNAVAQVFRDGTLLHSQPIPAGRHPLDLSALPDGVYYVQVHTVASGAVLSRQGRLIYKPRQ
jgi:hypothetical protein